MIFKKNESYKTLVNLSGGVDSTYLAWQYLLQNKNIVIHHCNMINKEGRYLVEKAATKNILKWFDNNNLSSYIYYETGFNYGDLYILKDIEVLAVFTGIILRDPSWQLIEEIAVSANSEDESNNPNDPSVINRREIINILKPPFSKAELSFPIIHISKEKMVMDLPESLMKLTWFCRRPFYYNSEDIKISYLDQNEASYAVTCKVCVPCKKILPVLADLGITYDKYYLD